MKERLLCFSKYLQEERFKQSVSLGLNSDWLMGIMVINDWSSRHSGDQ